MPDQLLFPQVLRDDLQNELFHHLSRNGDEADWMQFLALSEDWSDIAQAPPSLLQSPSETQSGSAAALANSFSTHWCTPSKQDSHRHN